MPDPYWSDDVVSLHLGNCLDVLREMPDASVDAVCTDPPYALAELSTALVLQAMGAWMTGDRDHVPDGPGGFMGKRWDRFVPPPGVWDECLRVLKPGGHLLAFAGSRTVDLMGLSIRIAGFELRDGIEWIYGSGFSKGINISKAIDKAAGAEREIVGPSPHHSPGRTVEWGNGATFGTQEAKDKWVTASATEDAARWEGWNTTLKPAHEPIIVARKPFTGTVISNILEHGTGALNIAACRVEPTRESRPRVGEASQDRRYTEKGGTDFAPLPGVRGGAPEGRWPTNLVFSHSASCVEDGPCEPDCPVAELDRQSGVRPGSHSQRDLNAYTDRNAVYGRGVGNVPTGERAGFNDAGGASRFFPVFRYEAKAPSSERPKLDDGTAWPTVKPVALMRWLVRLVTPPGGLVLDPFAGSGTTAEACVVEGFDCVLIDQDSIAAELIKRRLSKPLQPSLFGEVNPDA
jgi:site-specific DNA-methyltransferase (adenine-specific)